MPEAIVEIAGREDPYRVRINGDAPTFHLGSDAIRARGLAEIDPVHEDLLDIACVVFAATGEVPRGGPTRQRMGEGWRRRFHYRIPVRRPEIWTDPQVKEALVDAVAFMTEDDVTFDFHPIEPCERQAGNRDGFLDLSPAADPFSAHEVLLFSGGADSFAGALEVLSTGQDNVILVSHRGAPKVMERQDRLAEYLQHRFRGRVVHVKVNAHRRGKEATDTTQRSRSLLFTALGLAVARTFGAGRLALFENGIVSVNLPLSPQVVGTMATRTTHPLTLAMLNRLIGLVDPEPLSIANDYQWLTKMEVIERIDRYGGLGMLAQAVSCTRVREQTVRHPHCGACSQCLDRRFAVLAAGLATHDPGDAYRTEVLTGAREQAASRTMAVEWTRHALRFGEMDERALMAVFGLEVSRVISGHPELAPYQTLSLLMDLHRRHSEAVRRVLTSAIRDHADDLARRQLPETSLLRLQVGSAPDEEAHLSSDARQAMPRRMPIGNVVEEDVVPDPDAPLLAAFSHDGDTPVVEVRGLARVSGTPARAAHHLKPAFDDDRSHGTPPEQCRYVNVPPPGVSKDVMRQDVRRCRQTLARAFKELHGVPPQSHLLIQSEQPKGYRLDPHLRLTRPGGDA